MNRDLIVTDELIREAFERRARRGSPDGLRNPILQAVATTRQRRHLWPVRARRLGGSSSMRLLAVATLVVAGVGIGLVAVGARPDTAKPTPGPVTVDVHFVRPFEYPDGPQVTLSDESYEMAAFTSGGAGARPAANTSAYPETPDGSPIPGTRGVTISSLPAPITHGCLVGDGERVPVRTDPDGFLDDLRAIAGVGLGTVEPTTFDGRPARSVAVAPSANRCSFADFHPRNGGVGSPYVRLTMPSRLIVTQVDGMTIVVQAWAWTEDDLRAWLPVATEFVDGIHFTGQPSQSSAP